MHPSGIAGPHITAHCAQFPYTDLAHVLQIVSEQLQLVRAEVVQVLLAGVHLDGEGRGGSGLGRSCCFLCRRHCGKKRKL